MCDRDSDCTRAADAFCASSQDAEHSLYCSGRSEEAICLSETKLLEEIASAKGSDLDASFGDDLPADASSSEREFSGSGPSYCAESPTVWRSLELVTQADFDAMRGCEGVQGDLLLHVFNGADRRALLSLREVTGQLRVRSDGRGEEGVLDGLTGLEQAGSVSLVGLKLASLAGLSGLRRVG